MTAWTAHAAGDLVINEHDEGDPTADQELFLVLRGHAVFELDGDRVDAPAGTLVFAPPRTKRTASAKEDGTTIIALEGTPGQAYEARGWELWAPLAPLYAAGEYAEVADRLGALVAATPQYPMLFFNLACCESLSGRTSDALDHLRHAIEMSEEFRAFREGRLRPGSDPRRTRVQATDQRLSLETCTGLFLRVMPGSGPGGRLSGCGVTHYRSDATALAASATSKMSPAPNPRISRAARACCGCSVRPE